ncbi:MAG: flagellar hook-associated protein FlgK [Clostridia bacterium]|nr:flagellar hook-associated protein FlgK [Clostridia bacterium]
MRTTFFGLNIGAKGLAAQQRALDITGHNIVNANTEGYTRQSVVLQSDYPIKTVNGFVGTGVKITDVQRMRDNYLDLQYRTENKAMGYWKFKDNTLQKIEVILNEPSNAGLRSTLDKFWAAWEDLSRTPESSAVRTTVIETGQAVVETFNHMDRQFRELRDDIDNSINVYIREINSIASQIRDLNYQIVKGEAEGPKANDLRDKRDLLLDQLSEIVDIEVVEDKRGSISVTIGGRALVSGNVVNQIYGKQDVNNDNLTKIIWADGTEVRIKSGLMKGMLESRDEIVVDFMAKLDKMAYSFATKLNESHSQGFHLLADTGFITENYQGITLGNKIDFTSSVTLNGTLNLKINGTTTSVSVDGTFNSADELADYLNGQLGAVNARVYNVDGAIKFVSDNAEIEIVHTGSPDDIAEDLGFYQNPGSGQYDVIVTKIPSFFVVTDKNSPFSAANIAINTNIKDNVNLITAASNPPYGGIENIKGDGGNALRIAQLKYDATTIEGTTLDDYYRSETSKLGIKAREANRMVENQGLVLSQLENKREMVMGVSLDEEMTNMIRFQHAYNSAARYITVVDEMLEILINGLGRVGR